MHNRLLLLQVADALVDPLLGQGIQRLTQGPLVQTELPLQFVAPLTHGNTAARGGEQMLSSTGLGARV
jgi:hypothetical protein